MCTCASQAPGGSFSFGLLGEASQQGGSAGVPAVCVTLTERYFWTGTPASLITLAHLAISLTMKARNSSGVSPISVAPWLESLDTTSGSFIASTAALFSAATACGGVCAGATMPYQFSVCRA